ncbi:aldo/keto reductase [Auricularia subglabra TFB-10046 SS5]|nr:aldo/keto reductase [Auricularia subglabra TFB-10046 SS5]
MSIVLANSVRVRKVGHGLMFMTWKPEAVPDEQCFAAIRDTIDAQPAGVKAFLNSGEFYGHGLGTQNLELVARFFTKYPTLADKTFISIKGGLKPGALIPDGSEASIRRSVDNIIAKLGGTKKMDLYQQARVDPSVPIEDQIRVLAQLVKEGKFDHIGMSEVTEDHLRRAHAIHPIAAIEIQVSPIHYPPEIQAVIKAAKELGVAVIAYAPIAQGVLTNAGLNVGTLPEGDIRQMFPALKDEAQKKYKPVIDAFTAFANKAGITVAQASIAWVAARGEHVMPIPGSSAVARTQENRKGGAVIIPEVDLEKLDAAVAAVARARA